MVDRIYYWTWPIVTAIITWGWDVVGPLADRTPLPL
jgi:hypothetical protein